MIINKWASRQVKLCNINNQLQRRINDAEKNKYDNAFSCYFRNEPN